MTRPRPDSRAALLATQARLGPRLEALLARAAGWLDPPAEGGTTPEAPGAAPRGEADAQRRGPRRAPAPTAPLPLHPASLSVPPPLPPGGQARPDMPDPAMKQGGPAARGRDARPPLVAALPTAMPLRAPCRAPLRAFPPMARQAPGFAPALAAAAQAPGPAAAALAGTPVPALPAMPPRAAPASERAPWPATPHPMRATAPEGPGTADLHPGTPRPAMAGASHAAPPWALPGFGGVAPPADHTALPHDLPASPGGGSLVSRTHGAASAQPFLGSAAGRGYPGGNLEEELADILERAALEAGVPLP